MGQIQSIAAGERVFSTRFLGGNLFTVSTDTIQANDLLNPAVEVDAIYFGHLACKDCCTIDLSSELQTPEVLASDVESSVLVSMDALPGGRSVEILGDGSRSSIRLPQMAWPDTMHLPIRSTTVIERILCPFTFC